MSTAPLSSDPASNPFSASTMEVSSTSVHAHAPTAYRVSTITCNGDIISSIKRDAPVASARPRGRRAAATAPVSVPVITVTTSTDTPCVAKSGDAKKKDEFIYLDVFFEHVELVDPASDETGFIFV